MYSLGNHGQFDPFPNQPVSNQPPENNILVKSASLEIKLSQIGSLDVNEYEYQLFEYIYWNDNTILNLLNQSVILHIY